MTLQRDIRFQVVVLTLLVTLVGMLGMGIGFVKIWMAAHPEAYLALPFLVLWYLMGLSAAAILVRMDVGDVREIKD